VYDYWLATAPLVAIAAGHLILAGVVTAHALLHKADTKSAFGWIGVAWLSPIVGAALYWAFGINRVSRRATRLRRRRARQGERRARQAKMGLPGQGPRKSEIDSGADSDRGRRARPEDPDSRKGPWSHARAYSRQDGESAKLPERLPAYLATIAQVAEIASETPLTSGNSVEMLRCGDEAYPAMIEAIGRAKVSIALTSYIFRGDRAGKDIAAALAAAKARGVALRVMLDGFGAGYLYSSGAAALAAAGVPYQRFLHYWMPWRMPFLNMRNHKKLLIIDGKEAFTGGLNIGAENILASHPRHGVQDIHFRFTGPVVRQMMTSFAEDWSFSTGERLEGEAWWPPIQPAGPVLARGISSGPDEDAGSLEAVLTAAVSAAQRRLRVVTPYFLPESTLAIALALAAARGVETDVIIPERSDGILLDWAVRAHIAFMRAPGLRFHFSPGPFDHSKMVTVDGAWSLVGSANWDVRSFWLNFEFVVECYDETVTGLIDKVIEEKIAASRPFTPSELRRLPTPVRLRNAAARLLMPYL
jgi:cardiolipin synthase